MTIKSSHNIKYMWKYHPVAALDQDPPVQNTWYTILEAEDARILYISIRQINDELADKGMEVQITIDGEVISGSDATQANNTWFYIKQNRQTDALAINQTSASMPRGGNYPFYGHNVKIEVRLTSAPGTNQQLDGRVVYDTLEAT